ncbi:putative DNA modification/repair radical SAM protein [Afifella marina]|uniref:Putative DNA modification/repair radical SAM protein n=1 Tax=Afifella marina DSM 2698 TaxID=1120955 RepID=A0A1G5N144_AFIMA|nr:putative DNA modification/repair radical SAM protein [Afifella marina]MBK1622290.1 putative DNA modification/repair radical SAM protein [Afifella marina DSM 2698]MBK1626996.1 putative DNA modification/repair radical SAM protein [Afifella marina]MBK5919074.1 putative DNA modification/repair radical SAM protein [Afifella marina]RAI20190.1 putative DNA modification/repair radical SAM protein [Afifella marina DSM 2698]SCZ31073.1 putative DNA modification/repair radical SAM protein [Afifella mar
MDEKLATKLGILADAAKYDVSCASSGAPKRKAGKNGLGATAPSGICHAFTPDGRCVSLLKILLTNYCLFDCAYCINRRSSNVPRARFSVEEVVRLTLEFYKRNYIEGLFLSSGIARSPDRTMEEMMRVAKTLRRVHGFHGYIHLKAIPEASPWLIEEAGRYADRLSINLELASGASLKTLAPEKNDRTITHAMGQMHERILEARDERRRFSPAGQSTQVIVGADDVKDAAIIRRSARLYGDYALKRVYYSAFSPIPEASVLLPAKAPPLRRENRLYQADWLMRFYGFSADEVADSGEDGMLALDVDPKLAWALKNRERFPVDVNLAEREMLLRVPGLGQRAVERILTSRRHRKLRLDDLARLTAGLKRALPFLVTPDHRPVSLIDRLDLRQRLAEPAQQMSLF